MGLTADPLQDCTNYVRKNDTNIISSAARKCKGLGENTVADLPHFCYDKGKAEGLDAERLLFCVSVIHTREECTGKELEARLDSVHITANKNTVPGETRSPFVTSGVRLGTPAVTTRGMGVAEMKVIADCIADCIWHYDEKRDEISDRVLALTKAFPLYESVNP